MTEYKIGGRLFRPVGDRIILRHELSTQALIEKAGLARLQLLEAETPEDYALRVFRTAIRNTDVLLLIAHLIIPCEYENKAWTPKVSEEAAAFLGALDEEADKATVRGILVAALQDFLSAGLAYAVRSLSFSAKENGEHLPASGHTA